MAAQQLQHIVLELVVLSKAGEVIWRGPIRKMDEGAQSGYRVKTTPAGLTIEVVGSEDDHDHLLDTKAAIAKAGLCVPIYKVYVSRSTRSVWQARPRGD